MAKSKWFLLLLTEIFAATSLIVLIVSYSTDNWVTSEARFVDSEGNSQIPINNSRVSYGLFDGKMERFVLSRTVHDLTITCRFGENKCFYSCQQTSEKRHEELRRLLSGENLDACPASKSSSSSFSRQSVTFDEQVKANYSVAALEGDADEFLSAGLWLTTVVFLSLSSVFALVAAFFSMLNILTNPIRMLTSADGLYVWNGIAAGLCAITMIVWAAAFAVSLDKNVAVTDTLRHTDSYSSEGLARLGFSFWLLIAPTFCHLINIGLVYYRAHLLRHEPPPQPALHANRHKNDSTILVY